MESKSDTQMALAIENLCAMLNLEDVDMAI